MEKIFLTAENEENLEKIIRYNIGKANGIRNELKLLESTAKTSNTQVEHKNQHVDVKFVEMEIEEEPEEYEYYYSNIMDDLGEDFNIDIEELKQVLILNLPSTENKNYLNIVNRIKLELLKEIYEYEKLKEEETDEKYIEMFEKEISFYQNLIKLIDEILTDEIDTSIEKSSKIDNHLIFLKTHNGSIYAENDLLAIKEEYYESFQELLESIKNGTFKNVKRFKKNNKTLGGISEVKGFKTRVVFDRIDKDKYVIINIFIKKSDNDRGYQELLKTRVDFYKKHKDVIKEQLKDSEYIEENRTIASNLFNGLESKNLVKTIK